MVYHDRASPMVPFGMVDVVYDWFNQTSLIPDGLQVGDRQRNPSSGINGECTRGISGNVCCLAMARQSQDQDSQLSY